MDKIPYQNKGDTPVIIGGVTIPPGQTRAVDARLVPGAVATVETAGGKNPLLELFDATLSPVRAALSAPLTPDELAQLEQAESEGRSREDALRAIGDERVRQAANPDTLLDLLDENVATVTEALPACTPEDLDRLEAAETEGKTRKGVLEAIAAERLRRASEGGGSTGNETTVDA